MLNSESLPTDIKRINQSKKVLLVDVEPFSYANRLLKLDKDKKKCLNRFLKVSEAYGVIDGHGFSSTTVT